VHNVSFLNVRRQNFNFVLYQQCKQFDWVLFGKSFTLVRANKTFVAFRYILRQQGVELSEIHEQIEQRSSFVNVEFVDVDSIAQQENEDVRVDVDLVTFVHQNM